MRFLFALLAVVGMTNADASIWDTKLESGIEWTSSGMKKVTGGREFYYEYKRAEPGRPTYVLINGLTYSAREWNAFTDALYTRDPGVGIVRIDLQGQGKTLLESVELLYQDIPVENQIKDILSLLRSLRIQGPKISVGLSYGGAIALLLDIKAPTFFDQTISIASFLEPDKKQDTWIKRQIAYTRFTFPFNPASDEELYDYWLKQLIYSTYGMVEPISLENPYKLEAIFRMVKGIRKHKAADYAPNLPATKKLHFVQPMADEYVDQDVYERFWRSLSPSQKGSRLKLEGTKHKSPEVEPEALVTWILKIGNDESGMRDGKTFRLSPAELTPNRVTSSSCGISFR